MSTVYRYVLYYQYYDPLTLIDSVRVLGYTRNINIIRRYLSDREHYVTKMGDECTHLYIKRRIHNRHYTDICGDPPQIENWQPLEDLCFNISDICHDLPREIRCNMERIHSFFDYGIFRERISYSYLKNNGTLTLTSAFDIRNYEFIDVTDFYLYVTSNVYVRHMEFALVYEIPKVEILDWDQLMFMT